MANEANATGTVDRTLRILETLAQAPEGVSLSGLADELALPRSACHRLLSELVRCGYVRQLRAHGDYALTTKLPALGLNFLGGAGVVDIAQPIIDRLADTSGELVRLALVDGDRLTFVAKAQGARAGLRYDPDMGIDEAPLGRAMLGKCEGDEVSIQDAPIRQQFEVLRVY